MLIIKQQMELPPLATSWTKSGKLWVPPSIWAYMTLLVATTLPSSHIGHNDFLLFFAHGRRKEVVLTNLTSGGNNISVGLCPDLGVCLFRVWVLCRPAS